MLILCQLFSTLYLGLSYSFCIYFTIHYFMCPIVLSLFETQLSESLFYSYSFIQHHFLKDCISLKYCIMKPKLYLEEIKCMQRIQENHVYYSGPIKHPMPTYTLQLNVAVIHLLSW